MTQNCAVCGRPLPELSADQVLGGGRPRQTCGTLCKRRRDRRLRPLATLARWQQAAASRGNQVLAADFGRRIERILWNCTRRSRGEANRPLSEAPELRGVACGRLDCYGCSSCLLAASAPENGRSTACP